MAGQRVSDEVLVTVREAVEVAREAARRRNDELMSAELPRIYHEWIGFAWVITYGGRSPVTRALIQLGYAKRNRDGYIVDISSDIHRGTQSLWIQEQIEHVVAEVLTERLGQPFYMQSRDD